MDDLTGEFVAETREMLDQIGDVLLAWEARPDDTSRIDEVFRFVHTVKGSCGFVNQPRIEALAHAAETALAGVRDRSRVADASLATTMIAIIDRIGVLVAALETPDMTVPDVAADAALIVALDRRTDQHEVFEPLVIPQSRTVRIAVPLLEAMMNQVSELVLARNEFARCLRRTDDRDLSLSFDRLAGTIGELRESVTRTRMQPIERLFATLPRLVRDTARECGKSVSIEIAGQDVEIDREMVEAIRDPLVHIVRNAIDHGIEAPDDRIAAGKVGHSVLRITALQSGNQVSIEIADDGRGIDTTALLAKAITAKKVDAVRAATLDEQARAQLIFEAGLSTAATVSTISGRGVGMDVVRANLERLGGSVALTNRPGSGLTITLRAPLTLSIVNALVVRASGQSFAIPRGAIDEVISIDKGVGRVERIGGGMVVVLRGTAYPCFALAPLLGLAEGLPRLLVMIAMSSGARYALAVDAIDDHEELVVRPMAPQLAASGIFAGQSLGDDGRPIVVLDPVGLAARGGLDRALPTAEPSGITPPTPVTSLLLMHDLDQRAVAIRAAGVERLIETERADWIEVGGSRFVVIDGAHCPASSRGALPAAGCIPAVLLRRGDRLCAVPVQAIHDLVPMPAGVAIGADGIEALLRIDGRPVLLLDTTAFFDVRPVAVIALDPSPWARTILAPLIEAAGYDVSFEPDPTASMVVHREGASPAPSVAVMVGLAVDDGGAVAIDRYDADQLRRMIATAVRKSA